MSDSSLLKEEESFCQEYIIDFDAKQALIRSGHECPNPMVISRQLMNLPRIRDRIEDLLEIRSKSIGVDAHWVLESAVKLFNRCMTHEAVVDKDGNDIGVYKFDSRGANAALNTIGKHIGVQAFKKIIEHAGKDGGPMIFWGNGGPVKKQKTEDVQVEQIPSPLLDVPPVISFR